MNLLSATASMLCVIMFGAVFVHASEGWSPLDSVYWAIITCTSVGLGDLSISTASRTGNIAYMLLAVGTFAAAAAGIVHTFAEMEVQRAVAAFIGDGVNENLIAEMDEDGGGS